MRAVRVPQHLDAVVACVADDKVALAVKREEAPAASNKLTAAAACTAKAPQVRSIADSKHLYTSVAVIKHGKAARTVTSDCVGAAELAVAAALGADGSNMRAVTVPQHLNAIVIAVGDKNVSGAVKGDAPEILKLAVA